MADQCHFVRQDDWVNALFGLSVKENTELPAVGLRVIRGQFPR